MEVVQLEPSYHQLAQLVQKVEQQYLHLQEQVE